MRVRICYLIAHHAEDDTAKFINIIAADPQPIKLGWGDNGVLAFCM